MMGATEIVNEAALATIAKVRTALARAFYAARCGRQRTGADLYTPKDVFPAALAAWLRQHRAQRPKA